MTIENETSTARLRRKLNDQANEFSNERTIHPRSKSASSRVPTNDPTASLRYRRMRRKVDDLRNQIDAALQDNYLSSTPSPPLSISGDSTSLTRDNNQTLKKQIDEQNLVTNELVQVLHSKQTKIDELERKIKDFEDRESHWKIKYERECRQRDLLQSRVLELEKELISRKHQSKLLTQLQIDVKRLHLAFAALEAENIELNAELSLVQSDSRVSVQLEQLRHDVAQVCHESLC